MDDFSLLNTNTRLVAATDGSCLGNPGHAGWAWAIADNLDTLEVAEWGSGYIGEATNNIAELTALLELLRAVPVEQPLEIRLDSQYTLNAASKWRAGWKRRGWCKSDGKPIMNRALIIDLDAELHGRDIRWVWVKAHQANGDPLNAFVDEAARAAARAGI